MNHMLQKKQNTTDKLIILICLLLPCIGHAQITPPDPLSINSETRWAQYNRGNLVPNASFEKGRVDGKKVSITGWEIAGDDIEWIDKSSFRYSVNEVHDSSRSIRIIRNKAGEMDKSEGIRSDFIEVIPGNYQFTLFLKLRNISSAMERLGTKLYDAIDIRLEFFDDKKNPVDPKVWYPYKGCYIDNSFKGYSFSNFWNIEEFGWGMIIGRTYNYPFAEGDIPSGTRYIRVFIGLKGSGTMWVDKVDFRYSKWNFTPMERLKPYSEKDYSLIDLLVPAPKSITSVKPVRWYDKSKPGQQPVILMPANPPKQTLAAASMLRERLESAQQKILGSAYKKEKIIVTTNLTDSMSKKASIIFSIGNNELCLRYTDSLPEKAIQGNGQSYFIKKVTDRILFLKGGSALGDYYATATLVQLLEEKDFIVQSATIIDQPDFTGRSFLLAAWNNETEVKEDIGNMPWMAQWKLNKTYIGYGQPNKQWYSPGEVYKSGVRQAGGYCNRSGLMDMAVMVNPYYHLDEEMCIDSMTDKQKYTWTHSDPNSMTVLKNVFRLALDSGAKCIMLMSDDFLPHEGDQRKNYSLYTSEDKAAFINLQNAQASLINNLHKWLSESYPGTRFEFCPPWYLNEFIDKSKGKAEQYFADLSMMIPKDIAIVWTGNTVRSLSFDKADIYRYKQLIGRYPMLWDNTLYARSLDSRYGGYPALYPAKVRLCNIFEPFDIFVPADFARYNDGAQMYVNGDASSDCYKIKYMTVADFEWNSTAYNPDFSLWKSLCKLYGKVTAIDLLRFNDAYYGLMQVAKLAENGVLPEKDSKLKGEQFIKDLTDISSELAKALGGQKKLMQEIRTFKDDMIRDYKASLEKARQKKPKDPK
jgi:hypothetical protein